MTTEKGKPVDEPQQAQAPAEQPEVQQVTLVPAPMAPAQPEQPADEVPWEGGGGRFLNAQGQLVDHEGRLLNKDGSLKKEEKQA